MTECGRCGATWGGMNACHPDPKGGPVASEAGEIRAWAAESGYQVGPKGRIPAQIRAAYLASHGGA